MMICYFQDTALLNDGIADIRNDDHLRAQMVMERALMLRPDLLFVQLTADPKNRRRLEIDEHLPYLAMASSTAAAIVAETIQQAIAEG